MNKCLLSIIIPVYNLETYIAKCLDSIYCQGVDETLFEVVAIDDGSEDRTFGLLQDYAIRHSNMFVITQSNAGVSATRNNAMARVNGKYVSFIDGDDRIEKDSLSQIIEIIGNRSVEYDILYCRSFLIDPKGTMTETHLWQKCFRDGIVYDGKSLLLNDYNNCGSVCGGCFRTSFLRENAMAFGEKIANAEDTIFNYLLYAKNPRVVFADVVYYLVTQREGSASHSLSLERVKTFKNNFSYLLSLKKSKKTVEDQQAIDASLYHSAILATDMYIRCGGRNSNYLRDLFSIGLWGSLYVPWFPPKRRVNLWLLSRSFNLFFMLHYCRIKIAG